MLNQRTRELERSEAWSRTILHTVIDGIITIDEEGTVGTFNPAAERVFGYAASEVIGRNVAMLMPEPHHSRHDGYLRNYLDSGKAKIIGIGREVEGRHKDGTILPLELAVSEMIIENKRMFTGIVRDISDRKQAEKAKREFVSTVSHELRTPLTSIKGSLGLAVGGALGALPDKAKGMIDVAHKNTERLIALVNDILDMERLDSGRMEFHFEPVDLSGLARDAITANKGYADQQGITFVATDLASDMTIRADGGRITQVIANLLSNAAKFSPEGGTVEVSVVRRDDTARVSVTDRGPGIPEEFRGRIFGRFAQADASDTRKKGGTGLGLNISKSIVERHRLHHRDGCRQHLPFRPSTPEETGAETGPSRNSRNHPGGRFRRAGPGLRGRPRCRRHSGRHVRGSRPGRRNRL